MAKIIKSQDLQLHSISVSSGKIRPACCVTLDATHRIRDDLRKVLSEGFLLIGEVFLQQAIKEV